MNSRLIAVLPDNELDYVKSAANISDVRTNGVGVLDHDNRYVNVIGAILGWAELRPERNRENAKAADQFVRIREQGERAAALPRELLAFARRQVLQPRAVDVNAVISGLVTFLDRVIGKDIALEVHATPLDSIKADPTQVEQVLMNLCINARDAMPAGGRLSIESGMVEVVHALLSGRYGGTLRGTLDVRFGMEL